MTQSFVPPSSSISNGERAGLYELTSRHLRHRACPSTPLGTGRGPAVSAVAATGRSHLPNLRPVTISGILVIGGLHLGSPADQCRAPPSSDVALPRDRAHGRSSSKTIGLLAFAGFSTLLTRFL